MHDGIELPSTRFRAAGIFEAFREINGGITLLSLIFALAIDGIIISGLCNLDPSETPAFLKLSFSRHSQLLDYIVKGNMSRSSRLIFLCYVFFILCCISPSSSTPVSTSKAFNGDLIVAPRARDGNNFALSLNGEWRIIIIEMALLTPIRSAIVALEPFFRDLLTYVDTQLATHVPEPRGGFIYTERLLKLSFKCVTSDTRTCSWEAIRFFAEWQLERVAGRVPTFCRGALRGPGQQLLQVRFESPGTLGTGEMRRVGSASDLHA